MSMQPRPRALTLIEVMLIAVLLLVLVAMIAPALGTAREEARLRTCLGNLRTIGAAANAYLTEFPSLPFALPSPYDGASFGVYTEFIWGGGMPHKTSAELSAGPGNATIFLNSDVYRLPPDRRPLNRYLADRVYWSRPTSRRAAVPMDLPATFRCPTDRSTLIPTVGGANPEPADGQVLPMWEWWGASYAINWYWPYYYSRLDGEDFLDTVLGGGRRLLQQATGRQASELVLFEEGLLNYAAANARPPGFSGAPWGPAPPISVIGWHGRRDYHAAAFRDGSGRYAAFNTAFLYGDGWTLWPRRPWEGFWADYDSIDP